MLGDTGENGKRMKKYPRRKIQIQVAFLLGSETDISEHMVSEMQINAGIVLKYYPV